MSVGLIVIIAIIVLVLICVIACISLRNTIRKTELKCDEAFSDIDVALTKRYDMLTKLLDSAKMYAEFEKDTLLKSIEMRKGGSVSDKMQVFEKLDQVQAKFFGLAENYPDLKSSENYKQLQIGIRDAEDHLQASRRAYNANVTVFNSYFVMFPHSLFCGGLTKREFFVVDEKKREDVKIA